MMIKNISIVEPSVRGIERILRLISSFSFFGVSHGIDHRSANGNTPADTTSCCDRPDSGGYNEVFVLQQWASFGPRH